MFGNKKKPKYYYCQGQVALEGNFRFVQDKSDLQSAIDKTFVRKATVALENKVSEQNTTPCCEHLAISRDFPRSRLQSLFSSTKQRRILAVIVFFFFLVVQQQANINLMICCLLFMQNLRAEFTMYAPMYATTAMPMGCG